MYLFLGNFMLLNSYAVVAVLKSEFEKSHTILKSAQKYHFQYEIYIFPKHFLP